MSLVSRLQQSFRLQVLGMAVLVGLAALAVLYFGLPWAEQREREDLYTQIDEVLALQKETIDGTFDKFRLLTGVVAQQPNLSIVFQSQNQEIAKISAERLVTQFAGLSGAANVQLARPDGSVLAQSTSFRFAPLQIDEKLINAGAEGRLGRATILTSSGESAYGFSKGIVANGKVIGVVVVYVDLLQLGDAWGLISDPIFVTNPNGQKIIGNQLASALPQDLLRVYSGKAELVYKEQGVDDTAMLARGEYLPLLDWHLSVLTSYQPAIAAKQQFALFTMLVAIIVGGLIFVLLQRRHIAVIRLAAEQATARELEQRVQERTLELKKEYDERISAEEALRQAQRELMQSAKLASIGQMSAALSHEYNQPIAAIRAYADNAQTFLDKGKVETARDNLTRISSMTDRMAKLSKTLKSFARTPGTQMRNVNVAELVRESVTLIEPQANTKKVAVKIDPVAPNVTVLGGSVRLSQVLVNLLSNAIDAAANTEKSMVQLKVNSAADHVVFAIEDSGDGISEKDQDSIFDPFVTEKEVGEGLGLGLSIVYNIVHDFGGEIELGASQLGGAAFFVKLPSKPEEQAS